MCSYSISTKIKITEWHQACGRNASVYSQRLKIDQKRICQWDSKYEIPNQLNYDKRTVKRKFTNGTPAFSEKLDDSPFEFIQSERDGQLAISKELLAEEMFRIADSLSLGTSRPQPSTSNEGSAAWCEGVQVQ